MTLQNSLTELEAVNIMLSTIGEAPVNTLENSAVADAAIAQTILHEVSRDVQGRGWHFNTEKEYPLTPASDGSITVATNVVSVDLDSRFDQTYDIVLRGTTVYDRLNRTGVFTETLKATVILLFDFSEIPEAARRYICIRAARKFQDRVVGSQTLHGFSQRDELEALAAFKEAESDTAGHNIFNNFEVKNALVR